MKGIRILTSMVFASVLATPASGAEVEVAIHGLTDEGVGEEIGTVTARDADGMGLLLVPSIKGLSPGAHGFHVHQNPDCGIQTKDGNKVPGGAAGGHYDPENTGRHEGPIGMGHLGDLPHLVANGKGEATLPVIAPRLTVADLVGRSLMVHSGGDNYSDDPSPLGGGGSRVACGVVRLEDSTLEGER